MVYPYDGLSLADSPLGYVDHQDGGRKRCFLRCKEHLCLRRIQTRIEATGRRITANGVSAENRDVFNELGNRYGADSVSDSDARGGCADEALSLYQTSLKKPSLNLYCLDYSGSMYGEGHEQLTGHVPDSSATECRGQFPLQATEGDVNIVIPFNDHVLDVLASDSSDAALEELYRQVEGYQTGGGTDVYVAAAQALETCGRL